MESVLKHLPTLVLTRGNCAFVARRNLRASPWLAQSVKDPYSVLGVSRSASDKEIRNAFIELSKEYHPDAQTASTSSSDESGDQFIDITNAYESIKTLKLRQDLASKSSVGGSFSVHRTAPPSPADETELSELRRRQWEAYEEKRKIKAEKQREARDKRERARGIQLEPV